ncbi:MAG: phosphatidylcholine/phosphatidylserine synthase [Propionibacteriaceae bacterium]|nr:phosphatidylcholine/phosphatidylserine synthase [Propionibacteriaceae bacterium]
MTGAAPPPAASRVDRPRPRAVSQLPNIVTLMALACGLTAIRCAFSGNVKLVLVFMAAAALLDGLDGRLARALDAQSAMGAELDSLCDAIGFGVAPAFITYALALSTDPQERVVQALSNPALAQLAWIAPLIYVGAIVLRLARFNTLLDEPDQAAYAKEFFVGVPAPAAAWLALAPVVALQAFGDGWWSSPLVCSLWLIAIGCLAFSRLPTFTFKTVHLTQRQVPAVLFGAVIGLSALFTFPYLTIFALLLAYLVQIPFACRSHHWVVRHPQAWKADAKARRQMRRERRLHKRQAQHRRRLSERVRHPFVARTGERPPPRRRRRL